MLKAGPTIEVHFLFFCFLGGMGKDSDHFCRNRFHHGERTGSSWQVGAVGEGEGSRSSDLYITQGPAGSVKPPRMFFLFFLFIFPPQHIHSLSVRSTVQGPKRSVYEIYFCSFTVSQLDASCMFYLKRDDAQKKETLTLKQAEM